MFFYIGKNCTQLNEVNSGLYLDSGWVQTQLSGHMIWFKGYSTECDIGASLLNIISGYQPKGIWCVISLTNNKYSLHYPRLRAFPVHTDENVITNLKSNNVEVMRDEIETTIKTTTQVVADITKVLTDNCLGFVRHNRQELNICLTGGLDSTLILAVCEKNKIPYNIAMPKKQSNRVVDEYQSHMISYMRRQYTNYMHVPIFSAETALVTGFYGDNFLSRHPVQLNMLANSLGSTAHELVDPNQYVASYLNRLMFSHLKKSKEDITEHKAKISILHGLAATYQVWHIDNTLTFCPYYDMDIAKSVLSLETATLLDLSFDGTIQKEAIQQLKPELMSLLDQQKNSSQSGENLEKNIKKVNLTCVKKIFVV